MSLGHVNEELHQLLVGQLPNNEMLEVTDHLRHCGSCRQELVEVSLAHALLSSVSELVAPELLSTSQARAFELDGSDLPPLAFLEGSEPRLRSATGDTAGGATPNRVPRGFEITTARSESPGPSRAYGANGQSIPAVFTDRVFAGAASVRPHRRRSGSARPAAPIRRARQAMYRSGLLAVAAAVLVFVAIIGVGTLRHQSPSNGGRVLFTTALEPLGAATNARGTMTVRSDGNVSIATSGLKAPLAGHYYEVYLVDPGTSKMLPLGILPSVGVGKFSVPASLWRDYAGIDIRLQATSSPASSTGTSVLSTVAPSHRVAKHRPVTSRPPVPSHPKAHPKVHHPAPPPAKRVPPKRVPGKHHSQVRNPVPETAASGAPAVVRKLLGDSERQLTTGQALVVDTPSDAEAVDPASGLCRDSLGKCSLRAAVEVADALGTPISIRLPAGTYVLSLGALVATDPAGVTIDGASNATTIISSQGQDNRVLEVQKAVADSASLGGAVVSLNDLSLRGGTAPLTQAWAGDGGAILVADPSDLLELSKVAIVDSSAPLAGGGLYSRGRVWATAARFDDDTAGISGGAVEFENNMALISNSVFTGDSAGASGIDGGSGGAVDDRDAAFVLVYSSFTDDSVTAMRSDARGGAIEIRGAAWLASNVFVNDRAAPVASPAGPVAGQGGALFVRDGAVTVESSLFTDDVAAGASPSGGAIFNAAALTLNSSRFFKNAAIASPSSSAPNASTGATGASGGNATLAGNGGAVDDASQLTVTGGSFSANRSSGDGGALYAGGAATIAGAVFSRNWAAESGGAISDEASLDIVGTTLSHNVALLGGGIYVDGSLQTSGDAIVDNRAIGSGSGGGGVLIVGHLDSPRPDTVEVLTSTIAGNVAPSGAGIAEQAGSGRAVRVTISRSLISANDLPAGTEQDCAVVSPLARLSFRSGGGNVTGDQSCELAASTDHEGPSGESVLLAAPHGSVRACSSSAYGSLAAKKLTAPIVAIASSPGGTGYWEVTADGDVASFGSARFFGSPVGDLGNSTVTGFAATLDGDGYWVVTSDGQVFNYGDAENFGSATPAHIVGIARTVDGRGYWLLGANGHVQAFGDAPRIGSRWGVAATAIAATPDGDGYWIVTTDGSVHGFGDATSYGASVASGIVALLPSPDGHGYLLVSDHGQVFAHGDATWSGPTRLFPVAAAAT